MAQFKTLQFPNSPRGQSDKVRALQLETSRGWRVVSETIIPGKFKGSQACCLFLIFAPCAFLAGHKDDIISITLTRDDPDVAQDSSASTLSPPQFDRKKWEALVQYDKAVSTAAETIRPLGPKWIDELAAAYLVLNDDKYLPEIVSKVRDRAVAEQAEIDVRKAKAEESRQAHLRELAKLAEENKERARRRYEAMFGTPVRTLVTVAAILALLAISAFLLRYLAQYTANLSQTDQSAVPANPQPSGLATTDPNSIQPNQYPSAPSAQSGNSDTPTQAQSDGDNESDSSAPSSAEPAPQSPTDNAPNATTPDSPAATPNAANSGPDAAMEGRLGNTVVSRINGYTWYYHFLGDHTFNVREATSGYSDTGSWQVMGTQLCLTFEHPPQNTPTPACRPLEVHQVGDNWSVGGSYVTILPGIQ